MRDILNLAYLRIVRNRKNSLLFFMVLLLSFASAIVSVSVIGSISNTNAQCRVNTYGAWYLGIPCGAESDKEWLSNRDWVDGIGTAQSVGTIPSSSVKTLGIGTIDEELLDIGRIRLDKGTFPSNESEIAMEEDTLNILGYDCTLGQEITVSVSIPLVNGTADLKSLSVEKTYTLCGIIHEYSDLWYLTQNKNKMTLNSAFVTDTAASELISEAEEMLEAMHTESEVISVRQPIPQYFISVSEENRGDAPENLRSYLFDVVGIA